MRKLAVILLLGSMGCSLFSGMENEPPAYAGMGLSSLTDYQARFELRFAGDQPWTYTLVTRRSEGIVEYALALEGLGLQQDPGDVRAVVEQGVMRLLGPGTEAVCIQVPVDGGAGPLFLTPDDLIDPSLLVEPLVERDEETVAGVTTTHYALVQGRLGRLKDLELGIWIDPNTGSSLRYDLRLRGPDPVFGAGEGVLSGRFEVSSLEPQAIEPVVGCETDLPLPDDALRVTLLPGLVSFESDTSLEEMVAFFQVRLPQDGWAEAMPADIRPQMALLSYARGEETLEVNLEALDGKVSAELLLGP